MSRSCPEDKDNIFGWINELIFNQENSEQRLKKCNYIIRVHSARDIFICEFVSSNVICFLS